MPIDSTQILKQGYSRSIKQNGLMLMGIIFVISVLNGLLGISITRSMADQQLASGAVQMNPTLLLPSVLGGIVASVLSIALLVVSIGAIRVFVSDETERLPREYFTRNMVWAAINFVIGGIIFATIVSLGLVALIVPGIFLLVTLVFWTVYVAVEDQNFIKAFRSSWGLTRGYRLNLFALGVAVTLLVLLVNLVFGLGDLASGSLMGDIVALVFAQVASAVTTVFSTAVLATAYTELKARQDEEREKMISEDTTAGRPAA
ncbi:hypothetical protein SAMN05421858_4374 [Haladaptatus litoreus]|uniref:DUF7847 domain-containing protein n=1 Tax=Haladaptatus litoreus TaxID=553468 RepID=A0A1N7ELJ7_9EURY|nr:hypothetical protein [Haladaptatus litoreus]SIR88938.1 hypothetical protein SAMN05421858_4374 [Haladaptatus litoreus]